MAKEQFINCDELKKLVDKLHPDTLVYDLEPREKDRIFRPPVGDLRAPGAVFEEMKKLQDTPTLDYRSWNSREIRNIYEENCEE